MEGGGLGRVWVGDGVAVLGHLGQGRHDAADGLDLPLLLLGGWEPRAGEGLDGEVVWLARDGREEMVDLRLAEGGAWLGWLAWRRCLGAWDWVQQCVNEALPFDLLRRCVRSCTR